VPSQRPHQDRRHAPTTAALEDARFLVRRAAPRVPGPTVAVAVAAMANGVGALYSSTCVCAVRRRRIPVLAPGQNEMRVLSGDAIC
jgi:hypothetical protein